jgi:DNA repair protein RecO (recombination protein O)
MPTEKATALVLRTVEFSETSLVATLMTREFGKLGVLAKGARRLKSPFESALDLLCLCRIVFVRKSSEALDLLTEAKLLRRFRPAGRDLSSLYGGYYVAELLLELTDEYDPHPELFDLADETLAALSAGENVAKRLARFELLGLRLLGHLPSLDCCAECGVPATLGRQVAFGLGGVLCGQCREGKKHVTVVDAGVIKTMQQFANPQGYSWQRLETDRRLMAQLRGVLNNYITHLLGKRPKLHRYLASLQP